MDNTKEVSKAIKRWLEDNGYSLAKVAEIFDSSPQSVSNSHSWNCKWVQSPGQ